MDMQLISEIVALKVQKSRGGGDSLSSHFLHGSDCQLCSSIQRLQRQPNRACEGRFRVFLLFFFLSFSLSPPLCYAVNLSVCLSVCPLHQLKQSECSSFHSFHQPPPHLPTPPLLVSSSFQLRGFFWIGDTCRSTDRPIHKME